jgi:hypothetical protein
MAVGQQPPSNIYTPAQQQRPFNSGRSRHNGGGGRSGGGYFVPQQPTNHGFGGGAPGGGTVHHPTPYKRYENWHYCHTHGGEGTTPTPVQRAPGQVQGTTQTQPATSRWVAQALVFTRPSSHRQPAALRPTCAPKRNNSSSNVLLYCTSRCRQCRPLPGSKRHVLLDTAGCLQLATTEARGSSCPTTMVELRWPIPSRCICDAAWTAADGKNILSTPSATWILLTGRGGELSR